MSDKNTIVIDLDDTLLDSGRMYNVAIKELFPWGVNEENYLAAAMEEHRRRKTIDGKCYSFNDHLIILATQLHLSGSQLIKMKRCLLEFIRLNSGKFLFCDVIMFLDSFKSQAELILLTSGTEELQKAKLAGLGAGGGIDLREYFTKVIIAQKEKGFYVNELCPTTNRLNVFIDDSLRQINSVNQARPDVVTFWIDRGTKKINRDGCEKPNYDLFVKNLKQADNILSEMI